MEMARQIAHEMRMHGQHVPPTSSPTHGPRPPVLRPGVYGDNGYLVQSPCTALWNLEIGRMMPGPMLNCVQSMHAVWQSQVEEVRACALPA